MRLELNHSAIAHLKRDLPPLPDLRDLRLVGGTDPESEAIGALADGHDGAADLVPGEVQSLANETEGGVLPPLVDLQH